MRVLLAVLVFLLAALPARADVTIPVRPDLKTAGWEMLGFNDIPETAFRTRDTGAVEIAADKSSSVLYKKIADAPVPATRLTWDWQVIDPLPATDLSKTDGDDRVLSVYVAFSDGSMASKLKAMMSPLMAGKVLNYVWGGGEALDMPHPHFPDSGRLIVRRTVDTPTETWISESVDLKKDYERAFGEAAPGVLYIGISGDSDDLQTTSKGLIQNLRLE